MFRERIVWGDERASTQRNRGFTGLREGRRLQCCIKIVKAGGFRASRTARCRKTTRLSPMEDDGAPLESHGLHVRSTLRAAGGA
jgi:hypothetical protein